MQSGFVIPDINTSATTIKSFTRFVMEDTHENDPPTPNSLTQLPSPNSVSDLPSPQPEEVLDLPSPQPEEEKRRKTKRRGKEEIPK